MRWYRRVVFTFQVVTVGLAAAFVLLVFRPDLFGLQQQVVEVKQGRPVAEGARATAPASYADAAEKAAPAVVNIFTRKVVAERSPLFEDPFFRRFFGERAPRRRTETSLGSGVIVSDKGYVLTNYHVIRQADAIQVALRDGRKADALVVGVDPEADLAVLRVDLPDLPSITFGRSQDLRVGDVVLAIGNPFGVGQTVTQGIVSAKGRSRVGINTFENFIQTDAPINPGNSGGALVTTRGELVGINTAIFSRSGGSQGIGFAIPISLAEQSMRQIIEHGRVTRGWLGVEIQEVTPELAESFGLETTEGVLVAGVLRGGPAAEAGLRPGDVLTHVANEPVEDVRDALDAIASQKPGDETTLQLIREGETLERTATIAERPARSEGPHR
ncbi:MAG TPA: Do family serine endopeptidase [Gammaproteobacteria bacterium]|nr:Do family serine endopeptidase [Gammaproteobacteria bacterium]